MSLVTEESDAPGVMLPVPGKLRHKLKIPGFVRRPRIPKPTSTCTLVENTPPVGKFSNKLLQTLPTVFVNDLNTLPT